MVFCLQAGDSIMRLTIACCAFIRTSSSAFRETRASNSTSSVLDISYGRRRGMQMIHVFSSSILARSDLCVNQQTSNYNAQKTICIRELKHARLVYVLISLYIIQSDISITYETTFQSFIENQLSNLSDHSISYIQNQIFAILKKYPSSYS